MIRSKINLTNNSKAYIKNLEKNMLSAVQKTALIVQRQAVQLLNKSGKSMPAKAGINTGTVGARKARFTRSSAKKDGLYWYGEPLHRWVEASQPGSPPHKQSGRLQRSIMVEVDAKKMRAKVGPSQMLVYARKLELGGDGVAPRPYLAPAVEMSGEKFIKEISVAVQNTSS
jgi:hypothetical protein